MGKVLSGELSCSCDKSCFISQLSAKTCYDPSLEVSQWDGSNKGQNRQFRLEMWKIIFKLSISHLLIWNSEYSSTIILTYIFCCIDSVHLVQNQHSNTNVYTIKILKIGTPEIITVIVLQLEQLDFTVQYCVQKMQTE